MSVPMKFVSMAAHSDPKLEALIALIRAGSEYANGRITQTQWEAANASFTKSINTLNETRKETLK